jgi:pimeloyl-ACP methyl ester carboxylesterase
MSRRSLILLLLLGFLLSLSYACKATPVISRTSVISRPHSHYYPSAPKEANDGVIVFVHGVTGGDPVTWTNAVTHAYWPEMLAHDSDFKGFDIYIYDYDSPLLKNALTISELAEDMAGTLQRAGIFEHREVIFLCHSMGGLVTRAFLQRYQKYAPQVNFIYFFSTPSTGSDLARVAKFFSDNPQYGRMVPIKRDSFLTDQILAWNAASFPIASYCSYEAQPTVGRRPVVTVESATTLCNRQIRPILADHAGVVKPANADDKPYIFFKNGFLETRPRVTINVPMDLTVRQTIGLIVSSDPVDGGNFTVT